MNRIKRAIKLLFPRIYVWWSMRVFRRHSRMDDAQRRKEIGRLYRYYLNRELDWTRLKRYTEKMQWKKMYDVNPLEKMASDKYAVRQWVAEQIGSAHLIPLLGCWDSFDEIDFAKLPGRFVLKTTHASSNIFIVKDKERFDKPMARLMFKLWLSVDYSDASFEMNYQGIPRKIIAEQYMEDSTGELPDYKFMCFNGEPFCCWVDRGRFTNHTRDIYDLDWNLLPFTDCFPNSKTGCPRPRNFDKMIEIARSLSQPFLHVRVDLYNIDGAIYFGELTFCESSGFCRIEPDEYDYRMGEMWNLPIING